MRVKRKIIDCKYCNKKTEHYNNICFICGTPNFKYKKRK